jgi:hypothetical protein
MTRALAPALLFCAEHYLFCAEHFPVRKSLDLARARNRLPRKMLYFSNPRILIAAFAERAPAGYQYQFAA